MLLYNADCLEVLKGLPPATVDLVVTDPPYEITGTKGGGSINKVKHMVESIQQLRTAKIDKGYDFEAVNTELVRVMKNINIYIYGVIKYRLLTTSISM